MNEKIKNYLNIAIIAGIIFVGIAALSAAFAYRASIKPDSYRSFSVSAEGKIIAVPDIAFFSFGVLTEGGMNIADLQKENTEKAGRAITFLKNLGIGEKDIKTEQYNLSPRYEYANCSEMFGRIESCPPPRIIGYTISQSVGVKIRDFSKIGDALGGVVANGANNVSGLSFQIDDPLIVQNEAREEAIRRAQEKARSIAQAGKFRLGRLLSIEEGGPAYPFFRAETTAFNLKGGSDLSVAPAIEPGSQEIVVNVFLRYEIK